MVLGAQQSFTGGSYTQNFNGLPSTGTFTLSGNGPHALSATPINATGMTGWSLVKYSGSGANAIFLVDTGSSNTGAVYSFGSTSASDRALGMLLSGTTRSAIGVIFVNNSGGTISEFTVSYTGEQWRYGGTTGTDKLQFEYQSGGTSISSGTFTAAPALDFHSPKNGTLVPLPLTGALDGNNSANRTSVSATVTGLNWAPGQTLVLRWFDFDVAGSDDGLAIDDLTFTASVAPPLPPPPPPPLTKINAIQGSGLTSPLVGQAVRIEGVVTASFQGLNQLGGYYVQSLPGDVDANPLTSEGLFVFDMATSVAAGDRVTVTGTVVEFGSSPNTVTELTSITDVVQVGFAPLPDPAAVTLPLASVTELEAYEGMRAVLPQTLTVTNNFTLGRFGEFTVSNGRLQNPTNFVLPGAPAQALSAANQLNRLLVNDNSTVQNPDPTPRMEDSAGLGLTRRTGSLTTGLAGIIDNKFGAYVLEPTAPIVFVDDNPRGTPPVVGGTLKVVGGNVLNLFNGNGLGGGFPTARGASNLTEYNRQLAKIVAGLTTLGADIHGLTEVENDGHGPESALAQLVVALNSAAPAGTTYAFINTGAVDGTTDAIRNVLVYRTQTVEPVGAPAALNNPYFLGLARSPIAQTFRQISNGEVFTVCVNHFRAKGSAASSVAATDGIVPNPNLDQLDGQGTNNYLRVRQADTLAAWLATDPTGSGDPDFLIVGDLNSYTMEDPITALVTAGYIDLQEAFEGPGGYSYQFAGEFGHLDHALATGHLALQTTGAAVWHANADEPVILDYNLEFKSVGQQAINVGTPYRYSDHDSVIIGLDLEPDPTLPVITTQPQPQSVFVGAAFTLSIATTGATPTGFQWFKNGAAIAGATNATFSIASATTADSGSYHVVVTSPSGSVTSAAAVVSVSAPGSGGRLVNISVRSPAGTGAETLIVGFVVGGRPTDNLPLLIRASGPSLAQFGVSGTLADPQLTVFDGSLATQSNDNWGGNATIATTSAQVGAFAFVSPSSKDAALLATLPTRAYTVHVTAADGGTGVALAEIYDAGFGAAPARLVNISARTVVGTGDKVLIAGFVIRDLPRAVLIRAVGPTLAQFDVTGVLADPRLELYSGQTKLSENDNWNPADAARFTQVGAFSLPAGSKDSVIVAQLAPGAYTAVVSGVGATTGVALVEVYELP